MLIQTNLIQSKKCLLAFSAGIDSSALFFLLLKNNIDFDIAIVDYNFREQSKQEVAYAKELAKKYNKKIFLKEVVLENSNFEKQARDIRYAFFKKIIKENSYEVLLTAHQLNDKLEWFLMQLSKGAGLMELIGLNELQEEHNYIIYRPLLQYSKDELQSFLDTNKIKYFIDESNSNEKFKRNYFRNKFANDFLKQFQNGVKNSFEYLQKDLESLDINFTAYFKKKELFIYKSYDDFNKNIKIIDKDLKKRGILLSLKQREEIQKKKELVISHKIAIFINNSSIFIAPYITLNMDKKFKELCRINKIPKHIRGYLYKNSISPTEILQIV